MSKYNDFAKRLDEAFKAARSEYIAAMDEVEACEQAILRAKTMTSEEYAGQREAKRRRAELALLEAKDNMNKAHRSVWDNFDRTVSALKKELAETVRRDNLANPDAVDANTVKLIESGILSADDCMGLMDKFADNATMRRMVKQYASEQSKALIAKGSGNLTASEITARTAFTNIAHSDPGITERFDQLCGVANICNQGHRNRPMGEAKHLRTMSGKWEELAGAGIENF